MNRPPPSSSDERLGVWRPQATLASVSSGQWVRVVHSLGSQTALALVFNDSADAGSVLLRMAQSPGQPWGDARVAWPLDAGLTPDGRPYVVMPDQAGEPLLAALHRAPLRTRVAWVHELAQLLDAAAAQGLALVELDPSLLWIDDAQHVRLQALALVDRDAAGQSLGSLQGARSRAAELLQGPATAPPGNEAALVQSLTRLLCLLVNGRLPDELHPARTPVALLSQWLSMSAYERSRLDGLLTDLLSETERPRELAALSAALSGWLTQAADAPPDEPPAPADAVVRSAAGTEPPPAPTPGETRFTSPFAPPWQPPPEAPRASRALRTLLLAAVLAAALLGAWALMP